MKTRPVTHAEQVVGEEWMLRALFFLLASRKKPLRMTRQAFDKVVLAHPKTRVEIRPDGQDVVLVSIIPDTHEYPDLAYTEDAD